MTNVQFIAVLFGAVLTTVVLLSTHSIDRASGRWLGLAIFGIGVLALAGVVLVSFGPITIKPSLRTALSALNLASVATCGFAIALSTNPRQAYRRHDAVAIATILAALSAHVATMFFGFELGKLVHDAEMRQFFAQSGLPVWLMYLVMVLEILGAVGVCVPRWRVPASIILMVVMGGAVGTHMRNGDPMGDSLDAIRMLLLAASILFLTRRSPTALA